MIRIVLGIALLMGSHFGFSQNHELRLKIGDVIIGTYQETNEKDSVSFRTSGGVLMRFSKSEILSLKADGKVVYPSVTEYEQPTRTVETKPTTQPVEQRNSPNLQERPPGRFSERMGNPSNDMPIRNQRDNLKSGVFTP